MPSVDAWPSWTEYDYYRYFLSVNAGRQRMRGKYFPLDEFSPDELKAFCRPIRGVLSAKYGAETPTVSILLVAFNEQDEILPSLVSFMRLDTTAIDAELVVVDNASSDRTREVVEACGARYVYCGQPGTPFARAAGVDAAHPGSTYLWMTDGDIRVVPPLVKEQDVGTVQGTMLRTAFEYVKAHPKTVGVSTGIVFETTHWSHRLLREGSIRIGRSRPYSCWAGGNQFMEKRALLASGGVNTDVLFGEDHHRHAQLARWAKSQGLHLNSANMNPAELADPVYHSGRRHGTLLRQMKHLYDHVRRNSVRGKDAFGLAQHKENITWRNVRRDEV